MPPYRYLKVVILGVDIEKIEKRVVSLWIDGWRDAGARIVRDRLSRRLEVGVDRDSEEGKGQIDRRRESERESRVVRDRRLGGEGK